MTSETKEPTKTNFLPISISHIHECFERRTKQTAREPIMPSFGLAYCATQWRKITSIFVIFASHSLIIVFPKNFIKLLS